MSPDDPLGRKFCSERCAWRCFEAEYTGPDEPPRTKHNMSGMGYKEKSEDDDIIYKYGDEQAIEDGILMDISSLRLSFHEKPINRMTGTLWSKMEEYMIDLSAMGGPDKMQNLKYTIKTNLKFAKRAGEPGDEYMYTLPPNLWLVLNEVGGYTLMLPEDY